MKDGAENEPMSSVFDRPAPRWFTIGAERPFLDDLARGIVAAAGGGGEDIWPRP